MNAWLKWWQRRRYPKAMKHMADLHPRFALANNGRERDIVWRGRRIAALVPLSAWRDAAREACCYVLASGPSMQAVDLAALGDAPAFGVNGAIAKFRDHPDMAPHYYVITDPDFVAHRFHLVAAAFARAPHFFLSAAAMSAICEQDPQLLATAPVSLIETHFCPYGRPRLSRAQIADLIARSPALYARDWRIGFSRDAELGLFSAHTVAYYAIQLACYMGYRHVFLLGLDFSAAGATRFYENGAAAMPSGMDTDYDKFIRPSFEVLQRVCAADPHFSVHNLSAQSRLPDSIVPKISVADSLRLRTRERCACV